MWRWCKWRMHFFKGPWMSRRHSKERLLKLSETLSNRSFGCLCLFSHFLPSVTIECLFSLINKNLGTLEIAASTTCSSLILFISLRWWYHWVDDEEKNSVQNNSERFIQGWKKLLQERKKKKKRRWKSGTVKRKECHLQEKERESENELKCGREGKT